MTFPLKTLRLPRRQSRCTNRWSFHTCDSSQVAQNVSCLHWGTPQQ
nr:MAG TPA: hypothetical protein [Bacteriophage sp.]